MAYDETEPFADGVLDVGDGHRIWWSQAGQPDGKPVVLLHGGPGGGSSPRHRRMFDPERYRIVQFDQRNCGRSTPSAGDPVVDLSANTTQHLIGDIERLRVELGIERWMVWGGSWGSTLGLAYAQAHPESVTELIVTAVGTSNTGDVEWITRTMGRIFPDHWRPFVEHLAPDRRDGNIPAAYHELLMDPDPDVHHAAALAWCRWEDVHMSLLTGFGSGLADAPRPFRLCFARLVTHYWGNAAFLDDDHLVRDADRLAGVPTFLAHGRLDVSSPIDVPVRLAEAIPGAELFIAESDGHGGGSMTDWVVEVTDRLATAWELDVAS